MHRWITKLNKIRYQADSLRTYESSVMLLELGDTLLKALPSLVGAREWWGAIVQIWAVSWWNVSLCMSKGYNSEWSHQISMVSKQCASYKGASFGLNHLPQGRRLRKQLANSIRWLFLQKSCLKIAKVIEKGSMVARIVKKLHFRLIRHRVCFFFFFSTIGRWVTFWSSNWR